MGVPPAESTDSESTGIGRTTDESNDAKATDAKVTDARVTDARVTDAGGVDTGTTEEDVRDLDLVLDEVLVRARRESPLSGRIHSRYLTSNPSASLAEAITFLPGVSAVGRGAKSLEPVVRGQGWERVSTEIGCVPIYGACPARMDPPATYVQPHSVEMVEVSKGLGSLGQNSDGIGGSIRIPADYERAGDATPGLTPFFNSAYDAARTGIRVESGIRGGNDAVDLRLSASWSRFRDYESPNGLEIPASQEEFGASASSGWKPADGHRIWNSIDYTEGRGVDFPSLPMDSRETDFLVWNAGYRWDRVAEHIRGITIETGIAKIDHRMDNEDKPNRNQLHAETPSEARTYAGKLRLDLISGPRTRFALGANVNHLTRDAVRTRILQSTGQTFHDHLWPDARQTQVAGFAQMDRSIGSAWSAGLGLRLGITDSGVDAAQDPSLGGKTIEEQYLRFYGDAATEVDRSETTYGSEATLSFDPNESWHAHAGLDIATRPAGITERYFAFGPAPGGFQVGDPSLAMERKIGAELGLDWGTTWLDVGASAYYHRIEDYVLSTTLTWLDANGDGVDDRIRGFANIDARFQGVELALLTRPVESLQIPVTLSFVTGDNLSGDRPLPEIPPLEGTAALRVRLGASRALRLEVGSRFASGQSEIDAEFGEDESPAWATVRLEAAYRYGQHVRIKAGVENLFDTEYHEHLTREALLPVGDLRGGDEVPAPGRSFYAVVETSY